ncbi:MAG: hypothetical protein HQ510_11215 [Candidatus Marinimicrobia bacterium]|nr:hypothetical protein [Candidatus Neomarinimicrobiota bacterium]
MLNSIPDIILWSVTACLIAVLWFPAIYGKWTIPIVLAISFSITSYHNLHFHPHYQVWLCNFTALFTLILGVKFSQRLFDIVFYFAWTGDVFTFIVPDNQTLPSVDQYPIVWVAYWLKHIAPLVYTVYLIKVKGRQISKNGIIWAFVGMAAYTLMMAGYNVIFNQNILDLQEPTVKIEAYFGAWPLYVFVNMTILALWYYLIHSVGKRLKIIPSRNQ